MEAIQQGKAVGLGLGLKNSGLGNGFEEVAKAVIRFTESGRVEVRHCWTEMGQGVHTVALQVASQELGVSAEIIDVLVDTSRELGAGQTTGSRGTLMGQVPSLMLVTKLKRTVAKSELTTKESTELTGQTL